MTENSEWSEIPENGITLGPEETLLREIEKNKALKVEKLGLKNEVEKLRLENSHLNDENQKLKQLLEQRKSTTPQQTSSLINSQTFTPTLSNLLILIIAVAIFVLLLFFIFF